MFPVTQHQKNININHHAIAFDVASFQNLSGADAHCIQQAAETCVLSGLLTVCGVVNHCHKLPVV
jgi:hypothetical protein